MNTRELSELFERLGAHSPQSWAQSQIEEGIPQVARFLFLRQAWKLVISDDDSGWLLKLRQLRPEGPGGDAGEATERLMAAGCNERDLTTVVRTMQWQLLSGICLLLDEPGDLEREVEGVAWRLFQVDEDDRPISPIAGLAESVLETEPTGREMRPSSDQARDQGSG